MKFFGDKKNAGFSLLQVIITLALVTITLGLSIPYFSFLQRSIVRSEIEKMHSMFIYMQHMAIATQQDQKIEFDTDRQVYYCNKQQVSLPHGVTFGVIPGVLGPPSSPQELITKPITFLNNTIIFRAQGTMQAGTVYLIDRNKKYLYALTTPVSHISYIRRYKYDREWISI